MTALTTDGALRQRTYRRRPAVLVGRSACAVVALLLAGAVVAFNGIYRTAEANAAALVLRPFVGGNATAVRDIFWVYPQGFSYGFQVSSECTAILLIAPLLLLTAALFVFTRAAVWRVWLGTIAMYAIVTIVNEFRLALIALSGVHWGMKSGYEIAHVFVGSFVGIVGFAAGLTALILISVGRRRDADRPRRGKRAAGGGSTTKAGEAGR